MPDRRVYASVHPPSMNVEAQLLLYCARRHLDECTRERIQTLLQKSVNWRALISLAVRNKVLPLLYSNLRAVAFHQVPDKIQDELRRLYENNARRNLRYMNEVIQLARLMSAHGLRFLPYKGPMLAQSLYGNLGLRQFSDLDVLVPLDELYDVKTLLEAQGYRQTNPHAALNRAQVLAYARVFRGHDLIFEHLEKEIKLELHWDFFSRGRLVSGAGASFWQRLETVQVAGMNIPAVPRETLIRYLSVHGTVHYWRRLSWLCDVSESLRKYADTNWERLLEASDRQGSTRMFLLGPYLAHRLLETPLPPALLQRMEQEEAVLGELADTSWVLDTVPAHLQRRAWRFQLKARTRRSDRFRYLADKFAHPMDSLLEGLPLPAALFPIYHVLWPVLLLLRLVFIRPFQVLSGIEAKER